MKKPLRYDYMNMALEMAERGFSSKAQKKEALALLSAEYEKQQKKVMQAILNIRSETPAAEDELTEVYYSIPHNLHQFKEKHSRMIKPLGFEQEAQEIERLALLREQLKNIEITPQVKDTATSAEVKKIESLDGYKARLDYLNGIIANNKRNDLSVGVDAFPVINQHGTRFLRYMYYLNDKVISLQQLIYVLQGIEEKGVEQ